MTNVPLEAMLRRASRMAEQMFDEDGEVTSFWLAENAAGEQETIITPMVFPGGVDADEAKRMLAAKMREHFKEHNVVRYVFASEAWAAGKDWRGRPSEDPQRKEAVVLSAEDGCKCLSAMRDIVRPQNGKPYLTKLSDIQQQKQTGGRLADLLNEDKEVEQFIAALDRVFEERPGTGFGVMRMEPDVVDKGDDGVEICLQPLGFFFDYARAKDAVLADQAKMAPGDHVEWTRPKYTLVAERGYCWCIVPMTPTKWLEAMRRPRE
jgi:hypothetical protein